MQPVRDRDSPARRALEARPRGRSAAPPTWVLAGLFFFFPAGILRPEEMATPDTAAAPASVSAQSADPVGLSLRELSLREALLLAMRNNLRVRAASLSPEIVRDEVEQAQAAFDAVLTGSFQRGDSKTPATSVLEGAAVREAEMANLDLGVRRKMASGVTLRTDWKSARSDTNSSFLTVDPAYTSDLGVSVVQPLLQGRGTAVNRGPLRMAENRLGISRLEFRRQAISVAAATEKTYWDLVAARDQLQFQEMALGQARQLLQNTRDRVQAGVQADRDVVQAEAEVSSREEGILLAQQASEDTEDRLRSLTRLVEIEGHRGGPLVPITRPPLEPVVSLDPEAALQRAFAHRADYLSARLDLENRDIALLMARNSRYPQLDLTGSFGLNGVSTNPGNALDSLASTDFYDWTVGVSVEMPWGLRSGRSAWKRREAEKAQALILFKQLEEDITLEVRGAIRAAGTALKRIRATETARRLQLVKLETEQELLKVGRSTAHDVLEFQVDLLRAEVFYVRAVLDVQKAMVNLEEAQGTLLGSRGVEPESAASPP